MNTSPENQKDELGVPSEIVQSEQIRNTEKIPIKVNDLRPASERSFDLEKFLTMIERLRSEGLFKLSREFQESDYGKYMAVFASSESNHWDDAIQNAMAMEITLTTPPNRGLEFMEGRTDVEIKILIAEKEGRVFNFHFKDGKYRQGGWKDVHLEKRLSDAGTDQDFVLDVGPEIKKIEEK